MTLWLLPVGFTLFYLALGWSITGSIRKPLSHPCKDKRYRGRRAAALTCTTESSDEEDRVDPIRNHMKKEQAAECICLNSSKYHVFCQDNSVIDNDMIRRHKHAVGMSMHYLQACVQTCLQRDREDKHAVPMIKDFVKQSNPLGSNATSS